MFNLEWYDRFKTRHELENMLTKEYGNKISVRSCKSNHDYVGICNRDRYKTACRKLEVWDDIGNLIGVFLGFKPVKGGTVVYLVD